MFTTFALATLTILVGANASPLISDISRPGTLHQRTQCGVDGPVSCHNTTAQPNLCCFEWPGGRLDHVQLWDTNVKTSPADSWTIHGLWPDPCVGKNFSQSCDPERNYRNIRTILEDNGKHELVEFMEQFWMNQNGKTEPFWNHEWRTHGTCISTIRPACLSDDRQGADAAVYFQRIVDLFQSLNTFDFFAKANISPSDDQTYDYETLANAIKAQTGVTPQLDCNKKKSRTLYQIKYVFNLKGSLIDGTLVPIDAPSRGSCNSSGIKWPTKRVFRNDTGPSDNTQLTLGSS